MRLRGSFVEPGADNADGSKNLLSIYDDWQPKLQGMSRLLPPLGRLDVRVFARTLAEREKTLSAEAKTPREMARMERKTLELAGSQAALVSQLVLMQQVQVQGVISPREALREASVRKAEDDEIAEDRESKDERLSTDGMLTLADDGADVDV